ncbi:MAG: hypothetical protein HQ453_10245 [Actinobacteria bacterium]|nr:hypothetical protein [Actinomycetota bacterium]
MADASNVGDLLPEGGLAEVLQQRHGGLGSPMLVLRLAIAVTVSWLIALAVSQSAIGIFAPITTLLVVQSSPWSTLGLSLQRILGTGIGVLAASLWVNLVGLTPWSFFLGVLAALLVARIIPWSIAGQIQIPIAVVFVLALGPASLGQDLWRVLDVVIGGLIGLLAVYVYPPRPRPEAFERALETYRDAIVTVLRRIGEESGNQAAVVPEGVNHEYVPASRALRLVAEDARGALTKLAESARWNPRGRSVLPRLQSDARRLRRLGGMAVQIRGVCGAADLLFDRVEPSRLEPAEFRRIVESLVDLAGTALGEQGGRVAPHAPEVVRRMSDELAEAIRAAADFLAHEWRGPGESLESVSALGRLDHIRRQLTVFALAGENGGGDGDEQEEE